MPSKNFFVASVKILLRCWTDLFEAIQNSPNFIFIDCARRIFNEYLPMLTNAIVDYRFSSKAFESISRQRRGRRRRNRESESYSSTIALSAVCLRYWKVTLKKFYLRTRSPYTLISRLLGHFPLKLISSPPFERKIDPEEDSVGNSIRRTCDNF